jgi:hypothetical protein
VGCGSELGLCHAVVLYTYHVLLVGVKGHVSTSSACCVALATLWPFQNEIHGAQCDTVSRQVVSGRSLTRLLPTPQVGAGTCAPWALPQCHKQPFLTLSCMAPTQTPQSEPGHPEPQTTCEPGDHPQPGYRPPSLHPANAHSLRPNPTPSAPTPLPPTLKPQRVALTTWLPTSTFCKQLLFLCH